MYRRQLILVFSLLISGPALAQKPQIQWNPDYDFAAVQTFQWRQPPEASVEESDPFLHSRIVNAIEFQLTEYGLTEVPSNPDVYVTYHGSTRTDVRLVSSSIGYDFGGYGRGGWGHYGYGRLGPMITDTRVVDVERGTLVVDLWDASTDELVWRGSASGITVSGSSDRTQRDVVKAIEAMAKQYDKLKARDR